MEITQEHLNTVLKSGNWMIRTDRAGVSHDGFVSKPVGEKTICPDWDPEPRCGGGLHGQAKEASGCNLYRDEGVRTCFVETAPERVIIDGDKIKTPWFRILLVDDFSKLEKLEFGGDLCLSYSKITALPKGLHVSGRLYLNYSKITALPENLHVGGFLDLSGTSVKALPEGLHVGGKIYKDF